MNDFKKVVSRRLTRIDRDSTIREHIRRKIQQKIQWDIRVSNCDVHVRVKDDVVELIGAFDKRYRKAAIHEIVTSMPEVRRVVDNTAVHEDYERSDRELTALIQKEIHQLPLLKCEWMDVEVQKGVVLLEGEVLRSRMKAFASGIVWSLSGVRDCKNQVNVVDGAGAVAIALGLETVEALLPIDQRAALGSSRGES